MAPNTWHLLQRVGFEVEYAIVDSQTLNVRPIADEILRLAAGSTSGYPADVERGAVTWSNELVNHVIEMKVTEPVEPAAFMYGELVQAFAAEVHHANVLLQPLNARLLPTGMHPFMNPETETELWRHEGAEIYQAFDRLLNCHRHGWANVQSMHLNLSFSGDAEFARLHAAVRLLLPILPALAASSPIVDGHLTGLMDNRLEFYRTNSTSIHSLAGRVIPEPVYSEEEYNEQILGPIHVDLHTLDTQGILRKEFSNARGAIARFERGSLEIRLLDTQECPAADFFCAAATYQALRVLLEFDGTRQWSIDELEPIFLSAIRDGDEAMIENLGYLDAFAYPHGGRPARARDLWLRLAAGVQHRTSLDVYANEGCLARRMANALPPEPTLREIRTVYGALADCLAANHPYCASRVAALRPFPPSP